MNYQQALEYIHSTYKFGSKLGLENITRLLQLMGNPHNSYKSVHIAGTNGKGSTSAFLESILRTAGYKTGLFTSPYLERFTERIRIGGQEISGERLGKITAYVKRFVDAMLEQGHRHPTEFEIVTAIGFEGFKRERVDYAVVEVGLGGRLDSTNVIIPEIAVITSIGMDHSDILGNDLESISREKAGIIKEGVPVVLSPQKNVVKKVIQEVCDAKKAPLYWINQDMVRGKYAGIDGQVFDFMWNGKLYREVIIKMLGEHQLYNAATAFTAALQMEISEEAIREGLKRAVWPGRMEILRNEPLVMIDGAHNSDGAAALVQGLKRFFPGRKVLLVLGILRDKEVDKVAELLASYASEVITTIPDSPRSLDPDKLLEVVKKYNKMVESTRSVKEAIDKAFQRVQGNQMIVFAGSLYMIGQVRRLLPPEIPG